MAKTLKIISRSHLENINAKKLYDSVAGQLFHMLHHCFEGCIYRNEINAKNVFCHVKCFEKNENIWKVTRVTVFCQEIFGQLKKRHCKIRTNTLFLAVFEAIIHFTNATYTFENHDMFLPFSEELFSTVFQETNVRKNTALTITGPSPIQSNYDFT